jgi:hypothetical protein
LLIVLGYAQTRKPLYIPLRFERETVYFEFAVRVLVSVTILGSTKRCRNVFELYTDIIEAQSDVDSAVDSISSTGGELTLHPEGVKKLSSADQ